MFNQGEMKLRNKNLLIIFFDRVTKIFHIALFHPQDYSVDLIKQFLFEKPFSKDESISRNWVYIIEMFKIINAVSPSSYFYGHVDVKLALCRFISEFLLRLPRGSENYLDELVKPFYQIYSEGLEFQSFGGVLLLEYGSVFKALYVDRLDTK